MHTSTKARLTSVTIHIQIRIRVQIRHLDCHQNVIICSMVRCQPFLKISRKSIWKFLRKVANKQTTDKQRQKHIFLGSGNYKNWIHYSMTLYISIAFSALMLIAWWQEGHPACKNFVVRYWHRYLSAERCKCFAYGPADATATPSSLTPAKSRMVYLSGAGLPRFSWRKGR